MLKIKKVYIFLYSILLLAYFIVAFFYPISSINQDLGEELLQGKIISEIKNVPQTNLLSYTYPNFSFINTYWLSTVTFYQAYQLGGFNLLILLNMVVVGLAFGLPVFYAYKRLSLGSVLVAATIYLSLYRIRGDVRPESFSLLFLSIFVVSLLSFKSKPNKKIFLLIPLEILWINYHIYYFFGPVIVFLFLIDDLIGDKRKLFSRIQKINFNEKTKYLLYLFIGTSAATLINPYGLKGAIAPLLILPRYGISVTENQSIITLIRTYFLTKYVFDPLLVLIVIILLFCLLVLGKKNTKLLDWLLATVFSLSAILVFRNVALFVLGTFFIFASQVDFVVRKYSQRIREYLPGSFWFEASLSLVMIMVIILHSVALKGVGFGVKEDYKNAVNFLQAGKIPGPIYNNYNIGGYLVYRIYPNRVYIDNRPEAYPPEFTANIYSRMQNDPRIFESEDKKYGFNSIIVSYWDNLQGINGLLSYLVNNSNFVPIYLDSYAVVLIRNTPENASTIQKFRVSRSNINIDAINNPSDLAHYLLFFKEVGWNENAQKTAEKLNMIEPKISRFLEPY